MVTVVVSMILNEWLFEKKVKLSREPIVGEYLIVNITPDNKNKPVQILLRVAETTPLHEDVVFSTYKVKVGQEAARVLFDSLHDPSWTIKQLGD